MLGEGVELSYVAVPPSLAGKTLDEAGIGALCHREEASVRT